MGWGCQGGWEWRSEAFEKIQKKNIFLGGRGGSGSRWGGVGLGGVRADVNGEQRSVAFVKIQKKKSFFLGGGVGGVGVGVGGRGRGRGGSDQVLGWGR